MGSSSDTVLSGRIRRRRAEASSFELQHCNYALRGKGNFLRKGRDSPRGPVCMNRVVTVTSPLEMGFPSVGSGGPKGQHDFDFLSSKTGPMLQKPATVWVSLFMIQLYIYI